MPLNTTWTTYATPNVTGFYDMLTYGNSVTGNYFGLGLVLSLFMIFFITFRRFGNDVAFTSSSFISFILSVLLRATGLLGDIWVIVFIIMSAVSVFIMARS